MKLSSAAQYVLDRLGDAGYEAWTVGGCVRDSLRGVVPKDYDVATTALPFQTLDCFKNDRVAVTGLKHGTVTVVKYGEPVEVTTLRADGIYADGRHPGDVTFVDKLETDLARRDFTMNAMAWCLDSGYTDLFGGRDDLTARLVRCVGEPERRFAEDSLRIMRALRFSACLGFDIHEDTAKALHAQGTLLSRVSAERTTVELQKLLCGVTAGAVVREYQDILNVIMPDIIQNIGETEQQLVDTLPVDALLRLMVLLAPGRGGITAQRLKLDRTSARRLTQLSNLAALPPPITVEETVARAMEYGVVNLADMAIVWSTRAVMEPDQRPWLTVAAGLTEELLGRGCTAVGELAIGGGELIAAGLPAGPVVGKTLEELLAQVMAGSCPNTREALLRRAIDES